MKTYVDGEDVVFSFRLRQLYYGLKEAAASVWYVSERASNLE
jgi:hypothetical protein